MTAVSDKAVISAGLAWTHGRGNPISPARGGNAEEENMIGRMLASAALAAALTGTAMAQMTAPPPTNPPAPAASTGSAASGAPMSLGRQPAVTKPATGLSADRQTAEGQTAQGIPQGTPKLNVAGQLNACEAKPISQRQACIAAATR
jgi:hypothetical protein